MDNTNRGAIWKNEKKQKDTHPDFTGQLNADGKEYWVSAWKRGADANPRAPALSFSVQLKEDQASTPAPAGEPEQAPAQASGFDDPDIPF